MPARSARNCRHGVRADHVVGRAEEGAAVWRCSKCGATDVWVAGWSYYGSYECPACEQAVVEDVRCPECRPVGVAWLPEVA
jgi:predicted RNA-binding Zn-ribbon protein involved in translation (DUF1610 family)